MSIPNPLEILTKGLSGNGAAVEFKQKMPDGSLQDTNEKHLSLLNTRANVATMAQALQGLTQDERNRWAIATREVANEFYRNREFEKALEKYIECLTASNFGSEVKPLNTGTSPDVLLGAKVRHDGPFCNNFDGENDNIDAVIMPVLCNMAACCIQLKAWNKCILFCEQALNLRPNCQKAWMRKGIGLFHIGEFSLSIAALNASMIPPSRPSEFAFDKVSATDLERIKIYIEKAAVSMQAEKRREASHKKAMQRVFAPKNLPVVSQQCTAMKTTPSIKTPAIKTPAIESDGSWARWLMEFIKRFITAFINLFSLLKSTQQKK